jgi:hypothetical protein
MQIVPSIDPQRTVTVPEVPGAAAKVDGFAQVLDALVAEPQPDAPLLNDSLAVPDATDFEEITEGEIEQETDDEVLEVMRPELPLPSEMLTSKQMAERVVESTPPLEMRRKLTGFVFPNHLSHLTLGGVRNSVSSVGGSVTKPSGDVVGVAVKQMESSLVTLIKADDARAGPIPLSLEMLRPGLAAVSSAHIGPPGMVTVHKFELDVQARKLEKDAPSNAEIAVLRTTGEKAIDETQSMQRSVLSAGQGVQPPSGMLAPLEAKMQLASLDDGAPNSLFSTSVGEARSTVAFATISGPDTRAVSLPSANPVMQQVAVAVHKSQGGVTELILNPEELGRVRLAISTIDGTMAVTITTERAETQDLMRRHIETLAQEMRALGYDSVGFAFEGQGGGNQDQTGHEHPVEQDAMPTDSLTPSVAAQSGLDLRL